MAKAISTGVVCARARWGSALTPGPGDGRLCVGGPETKHGPEAVLRALEAWWQSIRVFSPIWIDTGLLFLRAREGLLSIEPKCALGPWGRSMTGLMEPSSDSVKKEEALLGWIRRGALFLANLVLLLFILALEKFRGDKIAGGDWDLLMAFLINAFAVSLIAMFLDIFYRKVSEREKYISIATVVGQKNKEFLKEYIDNQNKNNLLGLHSVQRIRGLEEIVTNIENSKSRVWILDWWEPNLDDLIDSICNISGKIDVRMAIQDQNYKNSHRAYSVNTKDLLAGHELVNNGIMNNVITLKDRRYDLIGAKIRHFQTNISMPLLIIDDTIYTGFYFHGIISSHRPQLVIDANGQLGAFLIKEFTNVWDHRCVSEYEFPSWVLRALLPAGEAS
jgi:hypothetical protein